MQGALLENGSDTFTAVLKVVRALLRQFGGKQAPLVAACDQLMCDGIAAHSDAFAVRVTEAFFVRAVEMRFLTTWLQSVRRMLSFGMRSNKVAALRPSMGLFGHDLRIAGGGSADDLKNAAMHQCRDSKARESSALAEPRI